MQFVRMGTFHSVSLKQSGSRQIFFFAFFSKVYRIVVASLYGWRKAMLIHSHITIIKSSMYIMIRLAGASHWQQKIVTLASDQRGGGFLLADRHSDTYGRRITLIVLRHIFGSFAGHKALT